MHLSHLTDEEADVQGGSGLYQVIQNRDWNAGLRGFGTQGSPSLPLPASPHLGRRCALWAAPPLRGRS